VNHLTIKHVRSTAKRARAYICTYYHLAQQHNISLDAQTQQVSQQDHKNVVQEQKLLFEQTKTLQNNFKLLGV